ncbi:MAG: hypothetical protein KAH08_05735 [Methylococcales bacterium]|nr:hypothetical protein [Methylococcales bacterium]
MPPLLPTKDISARNLWPLQEGYKILADIENKEMQLIKINQGSWLVSIENQWQMRSLRRNFDYNGNKIRQQFSDIVQTQQKISNHISSERCFAMTENDEGKSRLWQIVKRQKTLNNLIENSYLNQDLKKIAAILFIVVNKFSNAHKTFSALETQLPLSLDNLAIKNNDIIFTGFIPTFNETAIPSIEKCIQLAFQKNISKLSSNPAIRHSMVAYYLSVHASKNETDKVLVNALLKLFE